MIPEASLLGQVNLNVLKCDNHDTIAHQFLAIPIDNESHNGGSNDLIYSYNLRNVEWSQLLLGKKMKKPKKICILLTNSKLHYLNKEMKEENYMAFT